MEKVGDVLTHKSTLLSAIEPHFLLGGLIIISNWFLNLTPFFRNETKTKPESHFHGHTGSWFLGFIPLVEYS